MIDLPAEKRALRLRVLERILAMDPDDRRAQEEALVEQFALLPGFREAGTVLLFASAFAEEYRTWPILEIALSLNKQVVCPRVDRAADRLVLHRVEDLSKDLQPGMMGIPEPRRRSPVVEPSQIDWVLVPGLAFDDRGFRLGRGRGHYDRLLVNLRAEAPRWALALESQWVEALPTEPHDQQLDGIAGPARVVARALNGGKQSGDCD